MDPRERRWPRQVRMSEEEYRLACADADAAGLDFGKYVRKLLRDRRPRGKRGARLELERFVAGVAEEQARLQPLLPDVDPHDLNLILSCMRRPIERRRFF